MDIESRFAIQDLLGKAAYALDGHDMSMLRTCFADDAEFEIRIEGVPDEMAFSGIDEIMALFQSSLDQQTDQRRHVVTNLFFLGETGDAVDVVTNLTLTAVEAGDIALISSGIYRDRVAQRDGEWRIVRRRIELDRPY